MTAIELVVVTIFVILLLPPIIVNYGRCQRRYEERREEKKQQLRSELAGERLRVKRLRVSVKTLEEDFVRETLSEEVWSDSTLATVNYMWKKRDALELEAQALALAQWRVKKLGRDLLKVSR